MIDRDLGWLLLRIKRIHEDDQKHTEAGARASGATKNTIFRGCYDVILHPDDRQLYDGIMNTRIENARKEGCIINDTGENAWGWQDKWSLTEKGEELLSNFITEGNIKW